MGEGDGRRERNVRAAMAEVKQEKTAPPGPWVPRALIMGLCSESTEKLEKSVDDISIFSRPVLTMHQMK